MQIRKGNVPASLLARVHSLFCIYSAPARHEIARRAMNGIACIQRSEAVPSLSAWRSSGNEPGDEPGDGGQFINS